MTRTALRDVQEEFRLRGLDATHLDDETLSATLSPFGAVMPDDDQDAALAAQAAHLEWLGGHEAGARLVEVTGADGRKQVHVAGLFGTQADDRIRDAWLDRSMFSDWAPSPFDTKGSFLPDRQSWIVSPFRITRDTEDPLTLSNYRSALAMLGGEGCDVEVHQFGHWGPGWIQIVLVRPFSESEAKLERIVEAYRRYPVVDSQDLSSLEDEKYREHWENWAKDHFVRTITRNAGLDDDESDRLLEADGRKLREFFESLDPDGDHRDTDGSPRIAAAAKKATAEAIRAFLASLEEGKTATM